MVVKLDDCEVLYVDKNNNEDLTDDGLPLRFYKNQNELVYEVQCEPDRNQILRQVFVRNPELMGTRLKPLLDAEGNLMDNWAIAFNKIRCSMETRRGNFYFDDRLTLKRGEIIFDGKPMSVGLFDFTNNGSFIDESDLVLIDYNLDGNLNTFDFKEAYQIKDVISIGRQRYRLSNIDKYGGDFELSPTKEERTNYFFEYMASQASEGKTEITKIPTHVFTAINGEKVDLSAYSSSYLVLNFWGEWCAPCVAEIDELVEVEENLGESVKIISFLYTKNIENAKKMIRKKNMKWPQIILDEKLKDEFRIMGFPTNIILNMDKRVHERKGAVTYKMIRQIVN